MQKSCSGRAASFRGAHLQARRASVPARLGCIIILLLLCAPEAFAQPPQRGQARPRGEAVSPNVSRDTSSVAPLTSYEADAGPFRVKLESGTATRTSGGYRLSGGDVSVWPKSSPSKKLTISGANLTVKLSSDDIVALNGEGESLRGFGSPALSLEDLSLHLPDGGDALEIGGTYKAFELNFPVNLFFRNGVLSGEGSLPVKPKLAADADGTKLIPLGPLAARFKDPKLVVRYDSSAGARPTTISYRGFPAVWVIPCPPAPPCPVPYPNMAELDSIAADANGNIKFMLPEPSAVSAAADVRKEAREVCVAAAKKIPDPSLRDKAISECNSKNPLPSPPSLPTSVTVKAKDLVE